MKNDLLTVVVIAFFVGVLASSLSVSDVFNTDKEPPAGLQQGIATR